MKSTITEKEEKPMFPCLKKWVVENNDPFIVLFSKSKVGTVVWTENSSWGIGEYHEDFISSDNKGWEDFKGQVTLSN